MATSDPTVRIFRQESVDSLRRAQQATSLDVVSATESAGSAFDRIPGALVGDPTDEEATVDSPYEESADYGTPAGILRDPWVQRGLAFLGALAVGYGVGRFYRKR